MCELKKCKICNEEKEISGFEPFFNKRLGKTYYKNMCKKCINQLRVDRRKINKKPPVKRISVTLKCMRESRNRLAMLSRASGLDVDYSFMTVEWYNEEVEKQNGKCAICERHANELGRRLLVDHNHVTGKYRGLLCSRCNTGIGALGDNATDLLKAVSYLMNK